MQDAPWREMGLKDHEYERIVEIMGREPTYTELGMFSAMWSEHCGYKHSKSTLKLFPTKSERVLQGPGENAGIVDIGGGMALVMKMESHNHPSAIEPYQGAATGIGGILRDIFTMGARPVALLDSLRFGDLSNDKVKYLFDGVVSGIAGYGNCIGVPTVAGEVYFEEPYTRNPLVNVMCVGIMKTSEIARGVAAGVGNAVMVIGSKTGRDGIHGATFASVELDERSEERRPAVQVGDPFTEKLLVEACLEIIRSGYVVGIQDMGAAGLTSSTVEMAARAGTGMEIELSLVPRREEGMTPYEIMLSESQERMVAVVEPDKVDKVREIFARWGLDAVVVGHVTGDGLMRVKENGKVVAEIPAKILAEAPVYNPEARRPARIDELHAFDPATLPEPQDYDEVLMELISSPSIASKEWVYEQYDYMVRTNTAIVPGVADAAVLRVKELGTPGHEVGIALTVDCQGRYCYLDPYQGAAIAVAEASRNLACVGAEPLAITDCLNFGNPEKPEMFWEFQESVKGMADACRKLGIPVISGNVSFYNEAEGVAIYPTPVVGMAGLLPDVGLTVTQGFKTEGDLIVLLGATGPDMGGSDYLKVIHGVVAGRPPRLDLEAESRVQACCRDAARRGLLSSAHDCAEGGLAVALTESCISGGVGAHIALRDSDMRHDFLLFSESQGRIVVSLPEKNLGELEGLARHHGVPFEVIGRVGGARLVMRVVEGAGNSDPAGPGRFQMRRLIDLGLRELERAWRTSIARHMTDGESGSI
ncbi:MAG TPA: phosphoribosylformylglycinamidine synthase subunit PurL [Firmicutes bacterium]|nr:phosphoribosylformylglycinamidine synthase subunit PurL [Bacillota bacterium]